MGAVQRDGAFVVSRGEGAYIWDDAGTRYLDATAGLWFTNVGHGRTEIADAVAAQLSKVAHFSNFGDFTSDTTVTLAERLGAIAPVPGSKVFFTSGGSDSVDSAAKLARRYWNEMGRPGKKLIVGRQKAYHGMHVAGTALAGIPVNREGYGELMPDARTVGWDDAKSLLELIEREGADAIAAFFCEPIIGAGGIYLPPEGYLTEVRDICREHDILFVVDEVVTGFGRIGGSWFASTRFGLEPDMITTAKGLTSGYVPMGAVFVAPAVAEPFFGGGVWWRHGYTYGGHAGAAAAAMANLDIVERENLLAESKRLESSLHEHLAPLAEHPRVAEVRSGLGAVAAVQLVDPAEALPFVKTLRAHGVSGRAAGQGAMQFSPSFVMTDEQVAEMAAGVRAALG
ncbi:aspartate aminotransferase family protein [Rhodococcus hoagii]|jgi:adenosylmethionine-8-amino-7-oxononanoate aminotransferase|uniref:Aminotransferase class III-fold pyridoxal phosphate-dependent enzyme n=1 Tax=Rhodococcus hoagii TaxID=43767 RepID=A0AAE5CF02_RHOHA|nr:aminotransferase class III-fold pyridoxal phosphate-dependent enzyme [Prescottella equi]MBM9837657.1 aspartate aminotransferase family protein [Prescottella equi]NKS24944.1 aminotransferase class III-fold pyridoxal phosphate-dependent enzyme [Prescottella equi]NKS26979.1 aminotransferase class III-fold pyridoxal phosphate-dependent enzyme [Prescottella equi]NKS85742.1 aminotransferase class III-fold pyridoxal phosphate-dependent enzyme [Prescottella equi]NKW49592.1 aminotransferase class II